MSASARIEDLRKRYEENPRRFFAPLANEYRKSGDLAQAISICESHLSEQPGTLNGHVVYGQALYDAGRLDDARGTFENALLLDPENLIAMRHLGDIARALGDSSQAGAWYTRLLDADPRNHEIRALLADLPAPVVAPRVPTPGSATPARPLTPARPMTPSAPTPTTAHTPVAAVPAVVASVISPEAVTPVAPTTTVPSAKSPTPADLIPRVATPIPAGRRYTPPSTPVSPAPHISGEADGLMNLALGDDPPAAGSAQATDTSGVDLMFPPLDLPPAVPQAEADTGEILFDEVPMFSDLDADAAREPGFSESSFALVDEAESPQTEAPPPFVTETMAELYLQQGFRDEGLAVYRQLLSENPGDASLLDRIRALEGGEYSSLAFDGTFEDAIDPDSVAAEDPFAGLAAAEPAAAPVAEQAFTPPAVAAAVAAASPAAEPVAASRSAREFFGALATRRPLRRESVPAGGPSAFPAGSASPAPGASSTATLDGLFENSAVSASDEQLAMALAAVSQGIDTTPAIKGRPTQPATSELSLDAVFRQSPPRSQPAAADEAEPLRFDQFFSSSVGAELEADQPHEDAAGSQPRSTAELEQFQDWLQQLKKP